MNGFPKIPRFKRSTSDETYGRHSSNRGRVATQGAPGHEPPWFADTSYLDADRTYPELDQFNDLIEPRRLEYQTAIDKLSKLNTDNQITLEGLKNRHEAQQSCGRRRARAFPVKRVELAGNKAGTGFFARQTVCC